MLNHVGSLVGIGGYAGRLSEQFPRWAESIKAFAAYEFAAYENVYVKVGGLGQAVNGFGLEKLAEPPSSEMAASAERPYFETCVEALRRGVACLKATFPPDKATRCSGTQAAHERRERDGKGRSLRRNCRPKC